MSIRLDPSLEVVRVTAAICITERVEQTAQSHSTVSWHTIMEYPIATRLHEPGLHVGPLPVAAFSAAPSSRAVPAVQIVWHLVWRVELPKGRQWEASLDLETAPRLPPIPDQELFTWGL
jgi:hypothetical protein